MWAGYLHQRHGFFFSASFAIYFSASSAKACLRLSILTSTPFRFSDGVFHLLRSWPRGVRCRSRHRWQDTDDRTRHRTQVTSLACRLSPCMPPPAGVLLPRPQASDGRLDNICAAREPETAGFLLALTFDSRTILTQLSVLTSDVMTSKEMGWSGCGSRCGSRFQDVVHDFEMWFTISRCGSRFQDVVHVYVSMKHR